MRPQTTTLLLCLLSTNAAAFTATTEADDGTVPHNDAAGYQRRAVLGKKPGLPTSTIYAQSALAYAGATVILMPIVQPQHLAALLPKAGGLISFWTTLAAIRDRYLFGFLIAHEVMNDITSDVVAQAVTLDRVEASPDGAEKRLVLDWQRVKRSMVSAMASDDFPFLLWSRALWSVSERAVSGLRASSSLPARLVSMITHPFGVATIKMIITQLVYEPASSAGYLTIQALLKGQGNRGVMSELKAKFFTAWKDGLIYWSVAHMIVFSIPFWWLQPIADNVATLFFNSYLSMLSNDDGVPIGADGTPETTDMPEITRHARG